MGKKKSQVSKMCEAARQRMAEMSKIESANGFATPEDCDPDLHLRTAMSALMCALQREDWDVASDALVMMSQLHARVHPEGVTYEPWKL